VRQFGFFRRYFRVLAEIFLYFTNKFRDLTKKERFSETVPSACGLEGPECELGAMWNTVRAGK